LSDLPSAKTTKLPRPWQRRFSKVDLQEHEDKILLLLSLVISAAVGLIVVIFVGSILL